MAETAPARIPAVAIDERAGGDVILSCPIPARPPDRNMVELLIDGARRHPDRPLIVEHGQGGWEPLTYGQAVEGCRRVAQWLLEQGASAERPLVILSPRSRNHFLMGWGALMAQVPYCPVSVPYSTIPAALPKFLTVLERVSPAFVHVEDPDLHRGALDAIHPTSTVGEMLSRATFIVGDQVDGAALGGGFGSSPERLVAFADVLAGHPSSDVDRSLAAIEDDTVARYLFTSGSTGVPKGVIQTHGMHRAFLGSFTAFDARADTTGPAESGADSGGTRVLDWMPWSHTASGVMRLNLVINQGGTVYLDPGRPQPGHFDATAANLPVVRPTTYSGSPVGWAMLIDALEADVALAATFFANATSFSFGAAAMPESQAARLQQLARRHTGAPILLTTSLLSTEVSVGLSRWWPTDDHHVVGLPAPGSDVKLVPLGDGRYEIRVRGPGVTPGYLDNPAANDDAFDDEGYFAMGDAVRFADPDNPERGLVFAGRVAEDFKLTTGTWVEAGALRSKVVAAGSPYIADAVICGLNQAEVGALIWPNVSRCRELSDGADPARSPAVRAAIARGLAAHNDANPASSTRIGRFLLLDTPPDPGANEITEKGYVNQRAVQNNRPADVERLYGLRPGADDAVVIVGGYC